MGLEIVVLAAGKGTRMRSERPKVLHRIGDRSLLEHVYRTAKSLNPDKIIVVYGHGGRSVPESLDSLDIEWVEQRDQKGTGHAVIQTVDQLSDDATVLILCGDVPLLRNSTIEKLLPLAEKFGLAVLTVQLADPTGYGRIVRNAAGQLQRIVEQKDATDDEANILEVNTGVLAAKGKLLKSWLARLNNDNAQGEYYLTDIVHLAVADGIAVGSAAAADADEVLGVNTRKQLAHLERVHQGRLTDELMALGVSFRDPARFDLRGEIVAVGTDVDIDVNVVLEGRVKLGNGVQLGANCVLKDCEIGDNVQILPNCVLEGAIIGESARIGPFTRIRPDTTVGPEVHLGNFVELKKTQVSAKSKINHLSYVGDSLVGTGVNIGAGTITCNYDGANKFQTIIDDGAFIGSNTQLVAPVRVGREATTGAGSTITKDVPDKALGLGRARQVNIEGWQRPTKKRS